MRSSIPSRSFRWISGLLIVAAAWAQGGGIVVGAPPQARLVTAPDGPPSALPSRQIPTVQTP